jgi:ABC-type glycerol-3-phosphate transport system substrate-binding protein
MERHFKMEKRERKKGDPEEPERRTYLKTAAALVGGLAVGAAAGWLGKPPVEVPGPTTTVPGPTVTTTITKTPEVTTPTVAWWDEHMVRMDRLAPQWIMDWLHLEKGKYLIDEDYARTRIDWDALKDKYKGKTLHWAVESTDIATPELYKPGFEKLLGVKFDVIGIPPEVLHEKLMAEFVAGTGAYDACELFGNWTLTYADYMLDMAPYFEKYDLSLEDLHPAFRFPFTLPGGGFLGLSMDADLMVLTVRRNLLDDAGVDEIPRTWDDIKVACEKLMDLKNKTGADWYPWCWPIVQKGYMTYLGWYEMLSLAFKDLEYIPIPGWEPDFVGDEKGGVEAIKIYKDLLQYCPPGAMNFGYGDFEESYLKGKVAMAVTPQCIGMKCHDIERSTISPLVHPESVIEVYPPPIQTTTPTTFRSGGNAHATVYGISKDSKNPDLAFLCAIYQCSQEASLVQTLCCTGNESGYTSVLYDPYVWTLNTSYKACAYIANHCWNDPFAQIPEAYTIGEACGVEIHKYLSGEEPDPEKALHNAENVAREILEIAGYFKSGAPESVPFNTIDYCKKYGWTLPALPPMDPYVYEGPFP